jgi:hypothetical protein
MRRNLSINGPQSGWDRVSRLMGQEIDITIPEGIQRFEAPGSPYPPGDLPVPFLERRDETLERIKHTSCGIFGRLYHEHA